MQAFPEIQDVDNSFWALVKLISETLGYTDRRTSAVKSYEDKDLNELFRERGIIVSDYIFRRLQSYFSKRASVLNNYVQYQLMDAELARIEYERLLFLHSSHGFQCKLPKNKQKGIMAKPNYYTCIINILTEDVIRKSSKYDGTLGFNDDPKGLSYIIDGNSKFVGASSRRFDGAYPDIINPKAVWEIKEYYHTTTFGSRVADGVYETQLDGYEFKEIAKKYGIKVYHFLFIDAYKTWWIDGKSYLCRIIDSLNSGLVDEVIVGREVFNRWPKALQKILESN